MFIKINDQKPILYEDNKRQEVKFMNLLMKGCRKHEWDQDYSDRENILPGVSSTKQQFLWSRTYFYYWNTKEMRKIHPFVRGMVGTTLKGQGWWNLSIIWNLRVVISFLY